MRTIVAGSRTIASYSLVEFAIKQSGINITCLLSGTARGVDRLGEQWAKDNKVPVERYPADWSLGKQAGHLRNYKMALKADALIAIWDGESKGTASMIKYAKQLGLRVYVHMENR